jgi:hypothetical protein
VASGLFVIAMMNEEHHFAEQVDALQQDFGLKEPVSEHGVMQLAPSNQPAPRSTDLLQPVPEDQRDQLPKKAFKRKGGTPRPRSTSRHRPGPETTFPASPEPQLASPTSNQCPATYWGQGKPANREKFGG